MKKLVNYQIEDFIGILAKNHITVNHAIVLTIRYYACYSDYSIERIIDTVCYMYGID